MFEDKHIPRIYCKDKLNTDSLVSLPQEKLHHIFNVLRFKKGDRVFLFNENDGEFLCSMEGSKNKPDVFIHQHIRDPFVMPNINIAFSHIKPHRQKLLVEKATELGVKKFIPFYSKYTNIPHKSFGNLEQKIEKQAIEASEQCSRLSIPIVEKTQSLKDIFHGYPDMLKLFCVEKGERKSFSEAIKHDKSKGAIIIIGPEGGFHESELAFTCQYGLSKKCGLGSMILKSDTAALMTLSIWLHHEDLLSVL